MSVIAPLNPRALLRLSFDLIPGLLFCVTAFAVEPENGKTPPPDEVLELSPFTVSSTESDRYHATDSISAVRIRAALIDTGSSISVLTREFIDDISPGRLYDATKFVAGVQEGRIALFQDRMIFRGFENNNGRTVDNFLSPSGQNFDESLVERIEVAKGPNAILSPGGTPGGTVNVATKSPLFNSRGSITAQVGDYDAQKVTVDVTGPVAGLPQLAYRLIAAGQDSTRYWGSTSKLHRKVLSPMVTYNFSPGTQLTLKTFYSDYYSSSLPFYVLDSTDAGPNVSPALAPGLNRTSPNGVPPWSNLHYLDTTVEALFTTVINEHISLRSAVSASRFNEGDIQASLVLPSTSNRYNPYTGILTPNFIWNLDPTTNTYTSTFSQFFNYNAVSIDRNYNQNISTSTIGQVDVAATYNFKLLSTQTVAGFAISNTRGQNLTTRGPIVAYNLAAGQTVPLPDPSSLTNAQLTTSLAKNKQYYLNERLGFWNDRIYLSGGILHFSADNASQTILPATTAPATLQGSKNMGMAGIVYKPQKNISVYTSYSTNAAPFAFQGVVNWAEGKQIEYGVKSEFLDQRLSVNVAHFQISQTNVQTPNPARLADPTLPSFIFSDLKDHGLEFEVTGAVTKEISLMAAYTHLKLRDALGRPVRVIADDTGSLLVNYHPRGALKGWSTTLSAVYSGSKSGDAPISFTPLNVIGQPSFLVRPYTMINANISYHWRRMTFIAFVDNLSDIDRITQGGGRGALGLNPAQKRNYRLSTSLKF